jgi:WD40 repeat protein
MHTRKTAFLGCFLGLAWLGGSSGADAQPGPKALSNTGPGKDLVRRIGTMQFRVGDGILSLAYSPDGKYVACGARNGEVVLFDADTGQPLQRFKEPFTWALAFSPDGKTLATAGATKTIRLWDLTTGKETKSLKGHQATVKALAFSADGTLLASGGDDGMVRVWNSGDGSGVAAYSGHVFSVNSVAVTGDGKHVISAGADHTVRIWNGKRAEIQAPAAVSACVLVPEAGAFLAACDDGFLRVWSFETGALLREWKGHEGSITHLAMSKDGKTAATMSADGQLRIWDAGKGAAITKMSRSAGDADALALSPDGTIVAIGGLNNTVRRWKALTGEPLVATLAEDGAVTAVAPTPDGKSVLAAYSTGQLVLLDLATGKEFGRAACGQSGGDAPLAVSPVGNAVASYCGPGAIVILDLPALKESKRLPQADGDDVRCLAFHPDGTKLAVGHASGAIRVWDLASGQVATTIPGVRAVRALAYSRDGLFLASGADNFIGIFNSATGAASREYSKFNDINSCLAFSPDGRTLAAGMFATGIKLFDLAQPAGAKDVVARTLEGHLGVVNAVAWSTNGRTLISGGFDKTVRLWEFVNAKPIITWAAHEGEICGVTLDPLGRIAVSGSQDTTIAVLDSTRLGHQGNMPPAPALSKDALDKLWKELASDNNEVGNAAMWKLACTTDNASYLKQKVFLTDPKKVQKYLEDLNSATFKVREQAMTALAGYERWIEGVLRTALERPPSEEVRQRLELLLGRLTHADSISLEQERLRARRAIDALEQAATPAARDLLQALAAGAAEEDLRDMAKAAAARSK